MIEPETNRLCLAICACIMQQGEPCQENVTRAVIALARVAGNLLFSAPCLEPLFFAELEEGKKQGAEIASESEINLPPIGAA